MGLVIGNEYNYLNHSTNTNTIKNNSVTAQGEFSNILTEKKSSSHLNTGTVKFAMENGIAEAAYVDGIKMDLSDMFLTDKSQLKRNINIKYNKTDAEKLEEIFGL
ncbi:hypothetical protein Ccar_16805 [Clostridium carboxidivorans P7]|uniref:Uncharacterized protein n=1 Tax=Clostridium carboxidivorans P7 TaxID=536227 RepID=C6PSY6_9CLOT|nr:hypothetical protein [Clostridium carboxidivorans]AKN32426.1 hypothetical protein Ccar_16805 [Clostridium carboxidivorans P7]EET87621.1 hypothetical protein CcarbDRAFT_1903 [Clostridium carboxidivorans P7]